MHLLRSAVFGLSVGAMGLAPMSSVQASIDRGLQTGALAPLAGAAAKTFRPPRPIGPLKAGLDALAAGRLAAALDQRDALSAASLDRAVLTWAIAFSGGGGVPSAVLREASVTLTGWPGHAVFRKNLERALYRERPPAAETIAAFAIEPPSTVEGTLLLARALRVAGETEKARQLIAPLWRREKLEPAQEAAVSAEFGDLLTPADHRFRMERMLYAERVNAALRIADRSDGKALAQAWAAVIRGDRKAQKLLDAVPAAQRTAGFAFAQAKLLRKQERFKEAAAAMANATDPGQIADPDAWWTERRTLARELLDHGEPDLAYSVAAGHCAQDSGNVVDAEFHAGWIALRFLKDANRAAVHFQRLAAAATTPGSLARADYWLGRAAEAGAPGSAGEFFARAAAHGTTFYGQLAADRLGRKTIAVSEPAPSAADRRRFEGRDAVRAISRLEQAGADALARSLARGLAAELSSPGEVALLADRAERRGDHFLALKVVKGAAASGMDIGGLTHPVGVIPPDTALSGAGKALAYAVARQESEFNVKAVSGAGALGLLQLLPGTAKEAAKKVGLPFSKDRLTSDPAYNATLGAAFLSEQLGRFDGSYVLTFAGYNAGPRRAREWVARYGDPRGRDVDTVVDWIERIPFAETRAYVQRVMENYQVYKMRLSGEADIGKDLVDGR